jgi:hypothetical protein
MIRHLLLTASLGAALSAFGSTSAAAQGATTAPFSTITFSAFGGRDVGNDGLRDYWSLGTARGAGVAVPFYYGTEIAFSVLALPYTALAPEQPTFQSHLVALEWLYPVLRGPVKLQAGITGGDFLNDFDWFHESEFFAGGVARISVPLHRRLAVFVHGSRTRVFTRRPITHSLVTAGASATISTPRWLRPLFE